MHTDKQARTLQSAAAEVDVDVDRLYDVLTSPRRRFLLAHLQEAGSPQELDALADAVAHWELDSETATVPEDTHKAITVSLHHVHLPKMVEAGLLTYDHDSATVDTTSDGDQLASLECLPLVD